MADAVTKFHCPLCRDAGLIDLATWKATNRKPMWDSVANRAGPPLQWYYCPICCRDGFRPVELTNHKEMEISGWQALPVYQATYAEDEIFVV